MYQYVIALNKQKGANPFLKHVDRMSVMQARVYAEADHLLPEEQWAQITMRLKGYGHDEEYLT
jgi:hypothetical protein